MPESQEPTSQENAPEQAAPESAAPPEPASPDPAPVAAPQATEQPAPPTAPPAPQPAPAEQAPTAPQGSEYLGTGRRKTAIARVRLRPGSGKILINNRELDRYFAEPQERAAVTAPLEVTDTSKNFDVHVRVHGGGHSGQAGAILLGVARALVSVDERFEPKLRDQGYLTRDSRVVERKKYGHRKARRRFQFSKR